MNTRIYKNAKIYSIELDNSETRAEAIAIKDGIITFIGSNIDADKLIDSNTEIVDCKGGSLLPGFGDAHMHIASSQKRFAVCDLFNLVSDFEKQTPKEIVKIMQDRLKAFALEHKDAKVIRGVGWNRYWFSGNMHGLVYPLSKKDLDEIISDKPVVIDGYDEHIMLLNSKALELADIDSFDDPSHLIERDENGIATGIVREPVMMGPVSKAIPGCDFSIKELTDSILMAQKEFAKNGYTYLSDCLYNETTYEIIKQLAQNNELIVRIDGVFNCNNSTMNQDYKTILANRNDYNVGDLFKVDTIKYFVDGEFSMITPLTDEFCDENGLERGFRYPLLWDKEDLTKSMEDFQKEGFNIHVHSMGDYATRVSIDCMENAQKYNNKDLRNIIAHCSYVTNEDKKRMGDLKIIASIQPEWQIESNASNPIVAKSYGPELHRTVYPSKSLEDNNVICAYGSDFPVDMPSALCNIQVALTRVINHKMPSYNLYKDIPAEMPEECISLKQAIKNQTINVAYQFHRENITGSLKVGKSADFVVLDKDIENVPINNIVDINIVETVFKGKTTYKK